MSPLEFFTGVIAVAAALSAVMTVAFLIQQRTGNSGWIDTTWTFGLGLVMLAAALPIDGGGWHTRQVIVAVFAVVWASRLGGHIAGRSASIKDDPRYAQLIKNWGTDARRQMFWLCQKQALVSIPMGFAAFVAAHNPVPAVRVQDWLAIAVMAMIGVLGCLARTVDRNGS